MIVAIIAATIVFYKLKKYGFRESRTIGNEMGQVQQPYVGQESNETDRNIDQIPNARLRE
jgi:hypothetical protein